MGDFNIEPSNTKLKQFMEDHNLFNHIKNKTCFKSSNGKCIDLNLWNKKHSFQYSKVFETGLSDHHLLIDSMLKTTYTKLSAKTVQYRCYKHFTADLFLGDLSHSLTLLSRYDYTSFSTTFHISKHTWPSSSNKNKAHQSKSKTSCF